MRLQNIIDSIGPAIDRKIDALIADCVAPQIETSKISYKAFGKMLEQAQIDQQRLRDMGAAQQRGGLLLDEDYRAWVATRRQSAGQPSLSKSIFGFDLI